jgi:hypothetical protein
MPMATQSKTRRLKEILMANKPGTQARFVLFDVLYEDGSRRSNRKVPAELLGGLDGDMPARKEIEAQDNEIAKASGKSALPIASVERVGGKKR